MAEQPLLYPLKFKPVYLEKVWGGRRLEALGRTLPGGPHTLIGESWELADLGATSASGAGGGEFRSVVANGPLAGQTLRQVIQAYGETLLGRLPLTEHGEFPLLVKFLDSRQNLSLQVHPSPAYAAAHPDAHLKSEAWYILRADPDAVIYKGVQADVTAETLRRAIESGSTEAVERLLVKVPARPGDCHYLPSGTCHALGANILVAEVQTPSDTTFRLYDWGRTGRALHLEESLAAMDFAPSAVAEAERRSHVAGMFTTVSRLVTCEHFQIEKVRMTESYQQEIPYDQPTVWMVLEGRGVITRPGAPEVPFGMGETLLLPAGMEDARVRLDQDTVWLEITFPQAQLRLLA